MSARNLRTTGLLALALLSIAAGASAAPNCTGAAASKLRQVLRAASNSSSGVSAGAGKGRQADGSR